MVFGEDRMQNFFNFITIQINQLQIDQFVENMRLQCILLLHKSRHWIIFSSTVKIFLRNGMFAAPILNPFKFGNSFNISMSMKSTSEQNPKLTVSVSRFCSYVASNSTFSWIPFLKLKFLKQHSRCLGQRKEDSKCSKETVQSVELKVTVKFIEIFLCRTCKASTRNKCRIFDA